MTRPHHLANRLREVLLHGRWIANTNFADQLARTVWQRATQNAGPLNTIAMLTFHVNYYLGGVLRVLEGGHLDISDRFSFDMPPITQPSDWTDLVNAFLTNAENLANRVERMDDPALELPFAGLDYGSNLRNIEALIEHAYYHLGQISLIHKLLDHERVGGVFP